MYIFHDEVVLINLADIEYFESYLSLDDDCLVIFWNIEISYGEQYYSKLTVFLKESLRLSFKK